MKALVWLRDNTLIPLSMAAITAICSWSHMLRETEPGSYQTISSSWEEIRPEVRADIKAALLDDGKISRLEYIDISGKLTVKYIGLYDPERVMNVAAERAKVMELVSNPELRPYRSASDRPGGLHLFPGLYISKDGLDQIHAEVEALQKAVEGQGK